MLLISLVMKVLTNFLRYVAKLGPNNARAKAHWPFPRKRTALGTYVSVIFGWCSSPNDMRFSIFDLDHKPHNKRGDNGKVENSRSRFFIEGRGSSEYPSLCLPRLQPPMPRYTLQRNMKGEIWDLNWKVYQEDGSFTIAQWQIGAVTEANNCGNLMLRIRQRTPAVVRKSEAMGVYRGRVTCPKIERDAIMRAP